MTNAPSTSSFAAIKHQALEDQRQALLEEYQAANSQLARTLSDVDRVRLERQLRDLEQRISKTEADLAALDQPAFVASPQGATILTTANALTPSQRRHLEQEYSELQRRWDSLTRAIAALDTDISRTLEQYRKQPLEERRAERAAEREQVASRMAQIETDLGIAPSPQPAAEPAKSTPSAQSHPDQLFGRGNRWAVLIGVNSYEDAMHYGPLQVCVQDVEATREALLAGGFDPARIRLLTDNTDEKPTRANILAALQAVANATERDDLLLVYYSGHGDAAGGESYLVARDGRHLVLGDTAVPVTRVKQIVERAPARAKVLLLDACHSGADIGQKGPQPMTPEFIQRVFEQAEGLAILSSCKQGQVSNEWRLRERSVFTHYLLEALAGAADRDSKGFVTVQDANRHVANGVKLWASQRNLSQTPTLQVCVAGDIILTNSRQSAEGSEQ